jgi:class 3 adenylate cyclase/predicted ATPase
MNLAGWLRSLGLEQYEETFRQNAVDETVLPSLTAEDLKDLGVSLVGHRRKLLDAIAALRTGTSPKAAVSNALATTDRSPNDAAQRRHVTVMFSDLVGSTRLSARMDPEDLRDVISSYQKCVAETVRRFDGFVAKYLGDGVLVYFGYPHAHEDDAERAVRAGLELIAAVADLQTRASLQSRVGIATGIVVVGDLIGSGQAQEHGIVGETPNLAARLQGIAEPDTVIIADATQRLLGSLFELKDLGPRELKGIARPVRAWVALRPISVESRFDAMHASRLTALVGREEEFQLLLRRWHKAKARDGQVVLLSGEPGIGKSRLTVELLDSFATEPHTRLRYFCSPQHTASAFHPIIGQMERAAGLAYGDTPKARLDKLDALLAQTSTSIEHASLFAEMMSLSDDGRYGALEMPPQQRRHRTLQALNLQVEVLTRSSPVLMIFEDVHWADPSTLEWLSHMIESIRTIPVLLIVTFRPEFTPPWVGQSHVTSLTLNRLGQREVADIIERLVGNKELPSEITAEIVERTDGIPLFVEEMTKALLEAESAGAALQVVAATPSAALAVPASLYASLMARLDRLGPAKEIAQIGAAIGREFSHALLASVAHISEADLESALDRLIQGGLVFRKGTPPYATYLFKHALVQDAAYGTLLRESRRALHARIAETLESQFEQIVESQPELLAHHYAKADLINKAAELWGKAGERSLARSALVEATAHLNRALMHIAALPGTPALRREQIKFQVALTSALFHVKGYAAPETKEAVVQARLFIEQAEALGEPPDDPLMLFSVLYGFWVANFVAFNGEVIRDLSSRFLALAEQNTAKEPLMVAHRLMGSSLLYTGDIAEGREHYDRAIALYDPAAHRSLATRFGQDVGVAILSYRSLAMWLLGYPEEALRDADDALNNARQIGQAATLMYALVQCSHTQTLCGNHTVAAAQSKEVVALAEEKGSLLFWKSMGTMNQGDILALTGHASEAIDKLTSGIAEFRSTESTIWIPLHLTHLAWAHAKLGQFDDAWRRIDEAKAAAEGTGEKWCLAEIHRIAGEITLISPGFDSTQGEAHFERALVTAREQRAKSWELRTAMSMARLWREQDKRRAYDLLAPIYASFTEGFDTLDLLQAKALLGSLIN